jgi:DNA repair and recombination protein RAD54B
VEVIDLANFSLPIKVAPTATENKLKAGASSSTEAKQAALAEPPSKKFKSPLIADHQTNPEIKSSFMLPRPSAEQQVLFNPLNKPLTDVSVPVVVAKHLKDYQREGVEFLYESVMGFTMNNYYGCILSDEMGLGKTLQTLSLVVTLLKGGPYSECVAKRVLIVTPSSLVANWNQEVSKWLKDERVYTFVVDGKTNIQQFSNSRHIPIMLISYEMFLKRSSEINSINFDLLICDEGHRLKNMNLKIYKELDRISCSRRILITGTPFQNNLSEYFAIMNFVNPGIFGTYEDFRVEYELPILRGQQDDATEEEQEIQSERSGQMYELIAKFIIRRTQEKISKELPLKQELVVFIRPSKQQQDVISALMNFYNEQDGLAKPLMPFDIIIMLKKVCNHPNLFFSPNPTEREKEVTKLLFPEALSKKTFGFNIQRSGKLLALSALLADLSLKKERIVVVSYSTQALDMLASLMQIKSYEFLRLDGSTKTQDRTKIVKNFNDPEFNVFCLLLSSKSGGTGLTGIQRTMRKLVLGYSGKARRETFTSIVSLLVEQLKKKSGNVKSVKQRLVKSSPKLHRQQKVSEETFPTLMLKNFFNTKSLLSWSARLMN